MSKKSGVKQIASSRWSGTVADCILSDSSGDIKLTGFESQAAALDTLLEQNATYMISGAKVQAIRYRYAVLVLQCVENCNYNVQLSRILFIFVRIIFSN